MTEATTQAAQEIFLALTPKELDVLMQCAAKQPWDMVNPVIQKVIAQANAADMQSLHFRAHHRIGGAETRPQTPVDTAPADDVVVPIGPGMA